MKKSDHHKLREKFKTKSLRLHALVNLMRWSGLSITDAVTLG